MSEEALVIGGSIAGLQAALDLADAGLGVQLIETSPFFNLASNSLPAMVLHARQLEVIKHPNIRTRTNTRLDRFQEVDGGFQVTLAQHPRYIDLTRCTACGECIEVCPVTLPGTGHKAIYLEGQPGCAAIEKAGKAPCAYTCPAGIHVQGYVALIAQGRYREAIDLIHEAMPFPSVCGRVCNHSCEAECTRGKVDEPVNIMALKRFVADWEYSQWSHGNAGQNKPVEFARSSGKLVAIIGAGPAGLTAARDLNRAGHHVTVFDALPVAGGMMRVGIPAHRLPDDLLDWEIQRILDEGVELQLNTRIEDIPGLLERGYDAVLIATGAHLAKKLPIPNADHPDNWLSLDLLRRTALDERIDLSGKCIVVLGGGNVALDTARTALRLGASDVCMACLEPRGEMPGFEWEVHVAEEEGVRICPGRTFKEIVLAGDRIAGVRCAEVVFRGFKAGRPDIDEIPGTGHVLPAEIVIWAIGQGADLSFLPEDGSIRTRKPAGIQSNADMMTTLPGVFVAGDVHRGATFFVVDAIGEGHKVAASVDRYLGGDSGSAEPVRLEKVKYQKKEIESRLSQASQAERIHIASIPMKGRTKDFREVDLTITEEQALGEARRCLACGPCSECQACVQVCKAGAISHDEQATTATLNVRAIIYADDRNNAALRSQVDASGIYYVEPGDALSASAVAGELLAALGNRPRESHLPVPQLHTQSAIRVGAFICACGDRISSIIDTEGVRRKIAALPDVVYTCVLPFSCSNEAAETIRNEIARHELDRVVLAACSCCSVDQACYSCTYQRLRSRQNLGVLPGPGGQLRGLERVGFTFVNIREQCAWVHADKPRKATAKAVALIAGAIAGVRAGAARQGKFQRVERSVLVVGAGEAASVSRRLLKAQGILVETARAVPSRVARSDGRYVVTRGEHTWSGSALVLAPHNVSEAQRLLSAFGQDGLCPRVQEEWGGVGTHRPGVYYCDPGLDPGLSGSAAAGRAAAWLGRVAEGVLTSAMVDPARCRACGTCVEVCEFGAPELIGEGSTRAARIDPVACVACGTCSAHCPSGAISLNCAEGAVLESALMTILAAGD